MNFQECDFQPISALQHLLFCERQWALIHLEQLWSDNHLTAEGNLLHEKAHDAGKEYRSKIRVSRGLRLRSFRLGLTGQTDIVEFILDASSDSETVVLDGVKGRWKPIPVEYKRGRDKIGDCDRVQLCAQAICLEEMLDVTLTIGFIYYGEPRKRTEILFDDCLRQQTEKAVTRLHGLYAAKKTPKPSWKPACKNCSLVHLCLPRAVEASNRLTNYLNDLQADAKSENKV